MITVQGLQYNVSPGVRYFVGIWLKGEKKLDSRDAGIKWPGVLWGVNGFMRLI